MRMSHDIIISFLGLDMLPPIASSYIDLLKKKPLNDLIFLERIRSACDRASPMACHLYNTVATVSQLLSKLLTTFYPFEALTAKLTAKPTDFHEQWRTSANKPARWKSL